MIGFNVRNCAVVKINPKLNQSLINRSNSFFFFWLHPMSHEENFISKID